MLHHSTSSSGFQISVFASLNCSSRLSKVCESKKCKASSSILPSVSMIATVILRGLMSVHQPAESELETVVRALSIDIICSRPDIGGRNPRKTARLPFRSTDAYECSSRCLHRSYPEATQPGQSLLGGI